MVRYERVEFYRNEIRRVPKKVRFRRDDGTIVEFTAYDTIVIPKKVVFYRRVN